MNVKEAIKYVLEKAEKPLHLFEITKRILESALCPQLRGKTPERTVEAVISVDIKRNPENSEFIRVNKRTFDLRNSIKSTAKLSSNGVKISKIIDGVIEVLKNSDKPLNYGEITKRMLENNLYPNLRSKEPASSVGRRIREEIQNFGNNSAVIQISPGLYGLRNKKQSSKKTTTKGTNTTGISSLEAAKLVLKDAGEPLHVKEITKRIQKSKLCPRLRGKTPWATVNSNILTDIKKNGKNSDFVKCGGGKYSLSNLNLPPTNTRNSTKSKGTNGTSSTKKEFSVLEIAEIVLDERGDHIPMHYKTITERAIDRGWKTIGLTPDATFNARLSSDIKSSKASGKSGRFFSAGKGKFGLIKWKNDDLIPLINFKNYELKLELQDRLINLDFQLFEDLVAKLLTEMGYKSKVTKRSRDGGIDVRATLKERKLIQNKMAIQVKRWRDKVGIDIVHKIRGSLNGDEQGLIITTSEFTKDAIKEAKNSPRQPIDLINGKELVEHLITHKIGVRQVNIELLVHEDLPVEANTET